MGYIFFKKQKTKIMSLHIINVCHIGQQEKNTVISFSLPYAEGFLVRALYASYLFTDASFSAAFHSFPTFHVRGLIQPSKLY